MDVHTEPEILRTNLSSFILMLKALGIHNVLGFDLLNVPPIPSISHGLETLFALGAIDEATNLTEIGLKMSEFPTEPRLSRVLLESLSVGCAEEMLCIVSALQVRSLFFQPRTPKQQIDYEASMDDIRDPLSDHVTYLKLIQLHERTPFNEEECRERFINRIALQKACEVKAQLRRFLRKYGKVTHLSNGENDDTISVKCRKTLTVGMFPYTAKLANDGRYYALKGGHMIKISSSSVLSSRYGLSSEYILFTETYDGSRGGIEVRGVSSIEARWLLELAPHYFE